MLGLTLDMFCLAGGVCETTSRDAEKPVNMQA